MHINYINEARNNSGASTKVKSGPGFWSGLADALFGNVSIYKDLKAAIEDAKKKAKEAQQFHFTRNATQDEINGTLLATKVDPSKLVGEVDSKGKAVGKLIAKTDREKGWVQYQFSSKKVPTDFAQLIVPGGEFYNFVTDYEDGMVTMAFPLNDELIKKVDEKTGKSKTTDTSDTLADAKPGAGTTASTSTSATESMMTPVQVPDNMRSYTCDKDGKLIPKDKLVKDMDKENKEAQDGLELKEGYAGEFPDADEYEYIRSKSVLDSDGFWTDYTMYWDKVNETYIFIFGDNDVYNPSNTEPDWEEENYTVANEWFDSYEGFADDDDPYAGLSDEEIQADLDAASKAWGTDEEFEGLELKDTDDEDIETEGKSEVLNETPGLTLSTPKVTYKDSDDLDGRLEIEINGKKYMYRCTPESGMTTSEMASKVAKMQKFSDGKALAYLKKNMHLVTESARPSVADKTARELESKLESKFYDIAVNDPEWGFEDQSMVDEFLMPRIEVRADPEDRGRLVATVAAEHSDYDAQYDMDSRLNEVIQMYDSGSYFEQVEPGISEAVVYVDDRAGKIVDTEVPLRDQDYAYEGLELKTESLKSASPYMLRNDGKFLECGDIHPYVKYAYMDTKEAIKFLKEHPENLKWFYENTSNESTRGQIRTLVSALDGFDKEGFDIDDQTYVARNPEEVEEFIDSVNDETNQEFLRIRTSAMRYGNDDPGAVYARISSLHYDWYPVLWDIIEKDPTIKSITVVKDSGTFGGRDTPVNVKGQPMNHISRNEFLTLEGNPTLEMYKFDLDVVNEANERLLAGKTLSEAYSGLRPRYARGFIESDLKEGALKFDIDHLFASTKKVSEGLELKTEAHYGGAFDIADDQYFTRDDLDMFTEELISNLEIFTKNKGFDVADIDIKDGNHLYVEVDYDGYTTFASAVIDMRKIKTPASLVVKYVPEILIQIMKQLDEFGIVDLTETGKKMIGESVKVEESVEEVRVDEGLELKIEESAMHPDLDVDTWNRKVNDHFDSALSLLKSASRDYPDERNKVHGLAVALRGKLNQVISDTMNESLTEDKEKSDDKKVSFKDAYICKGCGNPLSKCTCEIEEESLQEDAETSTESYDGYTLEELKKVCEDHKDLIDYLKDK